MGVASHATLGSVIIDAIQDVTDPNDQMVVRRTSNFSHFTLSTAIFVSMLPFSFLPEIEYSLRTIDMLERGPWHPKNSKAKNWEEYCRIIRLMPISLFFASVEFTNGLNPTCKN